MHLICKLISKFRIFFVFIAQATTKLVSWKWVIAWDEDELRMDDIMNLYVFLLLYTLNPSGSYHIFETTWFKFHASFDVHFNYLKIIMCNVRCNILIINYFNFMQFLLHIFHITQISCVERLYRGLFGIPYQNKSFVMRSKLFLFIYFCTSIWLTNQQCILHHSNWQQ